MNRLYTYSFVFLRIIILVALVILPEVSSAVRRINYHSVNYSVKDGLSQNSVLSIAMDSRNILWVGTRIGLNYFNGKEFRQVVSDEFPEFNRAEIMQLSVDGDDVVWCFSKNRVYSYSYKNETLNKLDGKFNSVLAAKDGNVYVTVGDWVMRLDKTTGELNECIEMNGWTKVIESSDKYLYAINDSEIARYSFLSGETTIIKFPEGKYPKDRMQLHSDSKGRLWISNYKGEFYIIEDGSDEMVKWDDVTLASFIENQPSRMADDGRYMYFTSVFYGVVVYSPETRSIVSRLFNGVGYPSSISHNNISSVYYDRQDGMWIGSFAGGLDYINLSSGGLSSYKEVKNMPNAMGTVGQFAEFDDMIYVGTEGGLVRIDKATGLAEYEFVDLPQLRGLGFKCIARYGNDKLVIAPYMRGIHIYDINRRKVVKSIEKLPFIDFKEIYCEGDDRIWVAALGGVAYIDIRTNSVHCIEGLPHGVLVNSIEMSPDGCLYICTRRNGILCYDIRKGTVETFGQERMEWLDEKYITSVAWDKKDCMWISTFGSGVYRCEFEKGKTFPDIKNVVKYESCDGNMVNDFVVGTVEDGNNSVWCITLGGVSRISAQGTVKNYSAKSGWNFIEPTVGGVISTTGSRYGLEQIMVFLFFLPWI